MNRWRKTSLGVCALLLTATACLPAAQAAKGRKPHPTPSPSPTASPTPSPSPTSTAGVYPAPSSISSNGSADDTQAILAFFQTVPDGSTVRFTAGGTYRVDGTLELDSRNGLTIDGNGATFTTSVPGAGDRAHWRFYNGSNLTVENMTIHGANPNGGTSAAFDSTMQWQHGLDVRGIAGFVAHNVTVTDVYGDCFYLGAGSGGTWTSNAHLYSNVCIRNGRQGLAIVAGRSIEADHITFGSIALMTVDLEPNGTTGGASAVSIHDNQIGTGPRQQALGLIANGPISGVTFTGNTLTGKALTVLAPANAAANISTLTISNNSSDTAAAGSNAAAMELANVTDLTVTGNYVPLSGTNMAVVDITGGCRLTIAGNTFPGGTVEYRSTIPAC